MRVKGNRKPVTLVAVVAARKRAVETADGFLAATRPPKTTKPVAMPIRLKTTCTDVKVDNDMARPFYLIVSPSW